MREIILWFVAVCVIGLLVMVAEKLFGSGGRFWWVIRLMAGILAFVCFVMFILAILEYANMKPAL